MQYRILTTLGLLALTQPVVAQIQVAGLTHKSPQLIRQIVDGGKCAQRLCIVTNNQSRVAPDAGGTAYDGRLDAVWVTNGTVLTTNLLPNGLTKGCGEVCKTQKVPLPAGAKYCTGLAYLESGTLTKAGGPGPYGRLYLSYNNGDIGWADAKGCTLFNFRSCSFASVMGKQTIGAIALDDVQRRLLVGCFDSNGAVTVFVTSADKPCNPDCKFPLTVNRSACKVAAPLEGLTGMAYGCCDDVLVATDGFQVIYGLAPTGRNCKWAHRGCCAAPTEEYTGLTRLPEAQGSMGRSCTTAPCQICPNMSAQTTGEAVMGNSTFSIDLVNAPSSTSLYGLAIGLGPCASPGVNVGFCQPALVSFVAPGPFVFFLPPGLTKVGCHATARVPLVLPVDEALCGTTISFQWVVSCRGRPVNGSGISNCVTVTVSGV